MASKIVEKPLLSSIACLEHSNLIIPILMAISIEMSLGTCEYDGKSLVISRFIETIEAPEE